MAGEPTEWYLPQSRPLVGRAVGAPSYRLSALEQGVGLRVTPIATRSGGRASWGLLWASLAATEGEQVSQ